MTRYTRGAKRMLAAPLKTGVPPSPLLAPPRMRGLSCQRRNPAPTLGDQRSDNLFYHNRHLSSHLDLLCPFYVVPFGLVCSIIGVVVRIMVQSVSRSLCLVRLAHITAAGTLCFARYRCGDSACTVCRSRQDAAAPVLLLVQGNQPPFYIPAANQGSVSGDAALLTSAPF